MHAQYKFRLSEEHLLTSFLRYRQQIWWRRLFLALKWVLAALFGLPMLFAIYKGIPALAALFGAILGALLLGWPIDAWLIRKRFRKSPFHNDDIAFTLSESGAHVVSRNSEARIGWAAYTKARRFKDGLLLLQGPGAFNWLPDIAATDSTNARVAQELVRSHVKDYGDA